MWKQTAALSGGRLVYLYPMPRAIAALFIATLFFLPANASAQSVAEQVANRQQQLQNQLDQLEAQIAEQQRLLDGARGQSQTLQNQIDVFNAQIRRTELQIQAINLTITKLSDNIGVHNRTISTLSTKLSAEQESLAQILRQTQMIDDHSLVDVALGSESVSDFFRDLDAFTSLKGALLSSFTDIRQTSAQTEAEKEKLELQLTEQQKLRTEVRVAERALAAQRAEKEKLLKETKGVEANYQQLLASTQRSAAQIRSELFSLRDSAAIPFGTALEYAEAAQKATGVRAALILGVFKQETNLGENLGTGTWRVDMAPNRDQPVFVYITRELGLDPDKMPVSKRPSYGWGGAMGPGQFIPSTWVCYGGFINTKTNTCTPPSGYGATAFWQGPWEYVASKDRVRKLLGASSISNPWDAKTAIMATAMLLADNGADKGTRAAERLAALRYFAGWLGAQNPAYSFYGDGVMGFADKFQRDIDIIKGG